MTCVCFDQDTSSFGKLKHDFTDTVSSVYTSFLDSNTSKKLSAVYIAIIDQQWRLPKVQLNNLFKAKLQIRLIEPLGQWKVTGVDRDGKEEAIYQAHLMEQGR